MADVPLLETKIHMPRKRRDVVARPRLDARLDPARLPALTLVSAPAGFGKTTVLAEGLAASGSDARVAWVSLDRRDNDPRLFWSYVVAAIRSVAGEVGATAATMLQDGASSIDLVLTTLLNDLGRVETEVVLVLDDVHLIESTEVHDSVRFLLEHVPPQVHLVLASRADPPWPLAGLRARGELLELRGEELRFTADEAAAYLNGPMDLALTDAEVEALEARTEGWVAALQLAGPSLRASGRVSMDPMRKTALFAGLAYLATFAFSIPALGLYDDVLNNPRFVFGAGNGNGVLWGGLFEIITALTGIATAVFLYPVVRRYGQTGAIGFVASQVLEASMIFVGVVSVLSVFTLRQDAAGADRAAMAMSAQGLIAVKDWIFLLGPGLMAPVNAVCLATVLYRARLVPRIIPTLGLIGAPIGGLGSRHPVRGL